VELDTTARTPARRLVEAFGDVDAMAAMYAPNVQWRLNHSLAPNIAGPHVGSDAVVAFNTAVFTKFYEPGSVATVIHDELGDSSSSVVRMDFHARSRRGHDYDVEYVLFAKTHDGLITEVVELLDTFASNEQHLGRRVGVPPFVARKGINIKVNLQNGMKIEGLGEVAFGMRAEEMIALLGAPDFVYNGRHEFRKFGCFVDMKLNGADGALVVDAVEFWNDGAANVATVTLFDTDVLCESGAAVKAALESLNKATPVDGWYVNLDVFVSGGNPTDAREAIDQATADGTYEENKDALLESLERSTLLTSFGFGRPNYCTDGLAELAALECGEPIESP
jgi:ketosteroid isomerase-like protein